VLMLLIIWIMSLALHRTARREGVGPFLCLTAIALSPIVIIDFVGFLQQAFWLLVLFAMVRSHQSLAALSRAARMRRLHAAELRQRLAPSP
jgi:hypothetical protein